MVSVNCTPSSLRIFSLTTSASSSFSLTRTIATRSYWPATENTSATPLSSTSCCASSLTREVSALMRTTALTPPIMMFSSNSFVSLSQARHQRTAMLDGLHAHGRLQALYPGQARHLRTQQLIQLSDASDQHM